MDSTIKRLKVDEDQVDRTYQLLHMISSHLSGRADCRKIEYVVCIGVEYDKIPIPIQMMLRDMDEVDHDQRIYFYPDIRVFPDIHSRKQHNLEDVLTHVLSRHFSDEVYLHRDEYGFPLIRPGSLVPGVYKYALSFTGNRRKWIKVR